MSGLFATALFASIVETEFFGKIMALVIMAWLYVFVTRWKGVIAMIDILFVLLLITMIKGIFDMLDG